MGNYDEAVRIGQDTSSTPDITANEKPGRHKYGFGINIEQPIANDGEKGLFARLGWADGKNENMAFTEADYHISLGAQVSGANWSRPDDRFGLAYLAGDLSRQHRDYLAAGGNGFMLGDRDLNYGWEQIFETCYRFQVCSRVQITPVFQFIENPGYNRDRGPVEVYSLRVRAYF